MPRAANYSSPKLTRSQVKDVIAASDFADSQNLPLNLALHIHWFYTAYAQADRRKAVASLLESQRHWLQHRGVPFLDILVRENPGISSLGEHAHQLIHVPKLLQADFLAYVRTLLRRGRRHQSQSLHSRIPFNDGKLAYLCKGATPSGWQLILERCKNEYERQKFSKLIALKGDQGTIWGKRLFISRALGKKARRNQLREVHALAA